jgi:3-oxoacyl-ACP reductase-like protein
MLAASFRVVPGRLLPALLVAASILAGCGGSGAGEQAQTLNGQGFRFDAPAGWQVRRTARMVSASRDGNLVQVATFSLLKPYTVDLFDRVDKELRARMRQVAAQTGGTVSGGAAVTAGGIRSHSYDVTVGTHIDEYTFVLQGRREYQLLCRRTESSGADACKQLVKTFEPA